MLDCQADYKVAKHTTAALCQLRKDLYK